MTVFGLLLRLIDPEQDGSTPKMAGVFEVEVDGVEHDHGLQAHDEPNQVGVVGHMELL